MFNINFTYLIQLLLPPNLRKSKLIAWLQVIVSYLKKIYDSFILFRIDKLYEINFTGQIMYIEKKLQDVFEIDDLFISDGLFLENLFLSNISEGEFPVYMSNISENDETIYLANIQEYYENADFIINIPLAFYNNLTSDDFAKMNKIIDYYKLVEKTYTIQSYE